MAIAIKVIPTLRGEAAERFIERADAVMQSRERTDISPYVAEARAILRKAGM